MQFFPFNQLSIWIKCRHLSDLAVKLHVLFSKYGLNNTVPTNTCFFRVRSFSCSPSKARTRAGPPPRVITVWAHNAGCTSKLFGSVKKNLTFCFLKVDGGFDEQLKTLLTELKKFSRRLEAFLCLAIIINFSPTGTNVIMSSPPVSICAQLYQVPKEHMPSNFVKVIRSGKVKPTKPSKLKNQAFEI